jgi:hypothetical protein
MIEEGPHSRSDQQQERERYFRDDEKPAEPLLTYSSSGAAERRVQSDVGARDQQCFVGSCPGLFYGGCHGTDEKLVFEVLSFAEDDCRPRGLRVASDDYRAAGGAVPGCAEARAQ